MTALTIAVADLDCADVATLITAHVAEMLDGCPAESVHALDVTALKNPAITVWEARIDSVLAGVAALKELDAAHGELKSMRVATACRGRGVARALLTHIIAVARQRGMTRLSLETGNEPRFEAATHLYLSAGFTVCEPFADYRPDPLSIFLTLAL